MFKEMIQRQVEHQLEHPTVTREEVIAWLLESFPPTPK